MNWVKLDYNFQIKDHLVCPEIAALVEQDILERHQLAPVQKKEEGNLYLDPGGMIAMNNEPLLLTEYNVSVRPEHILRVLEDWKRTRILGTKYQGENIIKVYCNDFYVVVLTETLYNKIGFWLSQLKPNGMAAHMELVQALSDHPNIRVSHLKSEGDA